MYNAFKYKKDQAELKAEQDRVKPLKLRNPDLAKQKLNTLSNRAAARREEFIMKCDMEDDTFKSKLYFLLIFYVKTVQSLIMVETTAWPTKHHIMILEVKKVEIRGLIFLRNDLTPQLL